MSKIKLQVQARFGLAGQEQVRSSLGLFSPSTVIPTGLVGVDMLEQLQTCCLGSGSAGGNLPWIWGFPPPSAIRGGSRVGAGFPEGAGSIGCRSRWGWFCTCLAQVQPSSPSPGLSVSDADQRDLLLAMKTAPFPCRAASPQLPLTPKVLPAGTARGTGEGTWGHGDGWADLIPSGTGGQTRFGGGGGLAMDFRVIFPSPSPTLFQK